MSVGLAVSCGTFTAAEGQDYNGDGFADLAVGVPGEDVAGKADAGIVIVIYGSAAGLVAAGNQGAVIPAQRLSENTAGVPGVADDAEFFGRALAWGNFNGDQFDDLAIGVPFEGGDINPNLFDAGAVIVIYGSAAGLDPVGAIGAQIWHQDIAGIPDAAQTSDRFGSALAAADFNGDGKDDLAIGAPGEHFDDANHSDADAGAVNVIYGSPVGLAPAGAILWSQTIIGGGTTSELGDGFGSAFATGDFNNDGKDDLAIGAPHEDLSDLLTDSGEVDVLYGNAGGLGAAGGAQIWTESTPLIGTGAQSNNLFGSAIAAGDFDGDADDDVAFSAPGRAAGGAWGAGVVYILKSSPANGVGGGGGIADEWHFGTPGVPGAVGANERFGESLESGDFNGDQHDDLAIGAPFDAVGAIAQAGTVVALYGTPAGLKARPVDGAIITAQLWHQNRPGIPGVAAIAETFGWPLFAGDFDGDGSADLAVGITGDGVGGVIAGAVNVVYGSPAAGGLGGIGIAQLWHENRPGVPDAVDANDGFGAGLPRR